VLAVVGLSDLEFEKFSALIYETVGIHLKPEKKELLNARLSKRLRACNISSFKGYYDFIRTPAQKDAEWVDFLDAVSTNFTSFFRENAHFDYLTSVALPELTTLRGGGSAELSCWSSASSSGEEPYTIAMVLDDFINQHPGLRVKILATDISSRVLKRAVSGVYQVEQATKVPPEFLKRYFKKGVGSSAGKIKLKEEIRKMVSFKRFNLMHNFPWTGEMDVIFCRNVMIYFDKVTQEKLIRKFYGCLRQGGYLFIGHSESIASINHDFHQVEATTYRKL